MKKPQLKLSSPSLRSIQPKRLLYPGLFLTYTAVALFLFFLIAQFLAENLNKALSPNDPSAEADLLRIDMATYLTVAKKLGIAAPVIPAESEGPPSSEPAPEPPPPAASANEPAP